MQVYKPDGFFILYRNAFNLLFYYFFMRYLGWAETRPEVDGGRARVVSLFIFTDPEIVEYPKTFGVWPNGGSYKEWEITHPPRQLDADISPAQKPGKLDSIGIIKERFYTLTSETDLDRIAGEVGISRKNIDSLLAQS